MVWFSKKKKPVGRLARYYTREDVVSLMVQLAGAVFDGDAIVSWDIVEDTDEFITVRLDFRDEYMDIQFYRQKEEI